jgi:hypothetical protein
MEIFGVIGLPIIVTVLFVVAILLFGNGTPPFPYVAILSILVLTFVVNFGVCDLNDPHGTDQKTDLIAVVVIDAIGVILFFLFTFAAILEEKDKNKHRKR